MVKDPATVTAAHVPIKTPYTEVLPLMSPNGLVMRRSPITQEIMFKTSYFDNFSPIKKYAKVDVKIGDVNVKVVASEIGFI